MKNKLALALLAISAAPVVATAPALAVAHPYHHHTYHGHDRHYHRRCSGGNGAVGTIAGAAGGALIGNALGGGTLGTVAGGVGGGLLGRHFDKQHTRHTHGC